MARIQIIEGTPQELAAYMRLRDEEPVVVMTGVTRPEGSDVQVSDSAQEALTWIKAQTDWVTNKDVADHFGVKPSTANSWTVELRKAGLVRHQKAGPGGSYRYRAT